MVFILRSNHLTRLRQLFKPSVIKESRQQQQLRCGFILSTDVKKKMTGSDPFHKNPVWNIIKSASSDSQQQWHTWRDHRTHSLQHLLWLATALPRPLVAAGQRGQPEGEGLARASALIRADNGEVECVWEEPSRRVWTNRTFQKGDLCYWSGASSEWSSTAKKMIESFHPAEESPAASLQCFQWSEVCVWDEHLQWKTVFHEGDPLLHLTSQGSFSKEKSNMWNYTFVLKISK